MESRELIKRFLLQVRPGIEPMLSGTSLVSDGILDSLDIMNLVIAMESEFDIEIEAEDISPESFDSVDAITALVERYKS